MLPQQWRDWVDVVIANAGKGGTWASVPVPLWIRLPIAAAVVVWGARTDRAWTVPVAAMLALPALWYGGISMLLAVIPLMNPDSPWTPAPRGATKGTTDAGGRA